MKSFVSMFGIGLLVATLLASVAKADPPGEILPDGAVAQGITPFATDIPLLLPGRYWLEANLVDNGLGYSGSFATLGGKLRLFEDGFNGRWLGEAQGHLALENGKFFGNIGIERVISIDSAPADVSLGFFYDRDGADTGDFIHTFDQLGVSGKIKTKKGHLIANGYFPLNSDGFTIGDPTGQQCFFGHNIILQSGIDSALQGFDVELRVRPQWFAMVNGTFDIGGYSYGSDLVKDFGGLRLRSGMQTKRGGMISATVNYDDRFDLTGVIQLGWQFGGRSGRGRETSVIGQDLDKTIRNAHIVRYRQEVVYAINPATGKPYEVYHVDNTATPGGDGTVERRYDTLKEAEMASSANDIVFVFDGDGTTLGMDEGIILKNGQYLLGEGATHRIPIQGGRRFELCNVQDGIFPTITNTTGGPVVTMANNNTVRGFNIQGNANVTDSISAVNRKNGVIDQVNISGGSQFHGINMNGIKGDWFISNSTIRDAGLDGIHMAGTTGIGTTFQLDLSTVSNNGRDGVFIQNFDGRTFRFRDSITSNNIRHGVFMDDHLNAGADTGFTFLRHTSSNNGVDGVFLRSLTGEVLFLNPTITNNDGNGIHLVDVKNRITVTTDTFGTSLISGNGIGSGAGINVNLTAGTSRLLVENTSITNNGIGVLARSANVGAVLFSTLRNNVSISNNTGDGGRFISVAGSTHNVVIENGVGNRLIMSNNGTSTGNGLTFLVGDGSADTSALTAEVRNVNLTGSGSVAADSGILGRVDQNGQLNVEVENALISGSTGDGVRYIVDANNGVLHSFTSINNTISGSGDQGMSFDITDTSLVDINLSPTTISNSGTDAISIDASDTSFVRLAVEGSSLTGNGGNGININTHDAAQGLLYLQSSSVTGSGVDGVSLIADDASILSTRIDNNLITGSTVLDADFDTLGTGRIDALVTGNTFGTLDSENIATGSICLALSTNSFAVGATVTNNGAPVDYVVELDGVSNGIGQPTFTGGPGAFTLAPYGSICEPNIEAQEFNFGSVGFPARP